MEQSAPGPDPSKPKRSPETAPTASAVPAQGVAGSVRAALPTRIGRYTIIRVLGEGGMGTVYEARQDSPSRAVALKVIRAGYLSPGHLRRFEQESQVLGRLQHPGIAQVYEAGTVRDDYGQEAPFFAMEFIKGVPVTDYAATKNLGTGERLELLAHICDAVYHAHQKGVIHRDLKPGNILVDESGQPKILDFGVARATDSDVQQSTQKTDIGQLIGTVPYMSPEQVSGDPNELDTRSDVYALGVIAYELLAGRLPYDLQRKMIHEAARIIREEEPTRLSSINRTLRGDVETIVAKALEKDKTRRYQSAESLGSDIRRYLKDEPIAARPASTWYQLSKFSRRNKGLVGGVVAAFVVLLLGLGVSLYAFSNADYERKEKDKALVTAQKETEAAKKARKRAEDINAFVTKSLQSSDPNAGGRQDTTIAEAMQNAIRELDSKAFEASPETEVDLRDTIATILLNNGRPADAEPLYVKALEINRRLYKGDHPEVAGSLNNLANVRRNLGRFAETEPLFVEALNMHRRLFKGDHPEVANSLNDLACELQDLGRYTEAELSYIEALEMYRRLNKGDHREVAHCLSNLADLRQSQGRSAEAEPLSVEALEMRRRLFKGDHPDVAYGLNQLANLRQATGHAAEAEPLSVEALEMRRRLFRGDHPDVAANLKTLAVIRQTLGRAQEAEPLLVEALEMYRRLYSGDHPVVAVTLCVLARTRQTLSKNTEARQGFDDGVAMFHRLSPEGSALVARALFQSASARLENKDVAAALPELEEAVAMAEKFLPPEHPQLKHYREQLAKCKAALPK